jgi:hypothetical protein
VTLRATGANAGRPNLVQRARGHASDALPFGDVAHDDGACGDERAVADSDSFDHDGADAHVGPLADRDEAGEADARCDVRVGCEAAVVLDDRPGVDDDVVTYLGARVHGRGSQHLGAAAKPRPGGDDRGRVDDRRDLEARGE